MKYGRLEVLESFKTKSKHTKFICLCDCGNKVEVYSHHAKSGATQSCGCLNKEVHTTHGQSLSRLYSIADSIMSRCSPNYHNKERYCDRGIENRLGATRGEIYENLLKIPGYKEGLSVDRIDNNGHYELGNLKWSTQREQALNSSICKSQEWYSENHSFRQTFKSVCKKRGWNILDFVQIDSGIVNSCGDRRYYYIRKSM